MEAKLKLSSQFALVRLLFATVVTQTKMRSMREILGSITIAEKRGRAMAGKRNECVWSVRKKKKQSSDLK